MFFFIFIKFINCRCGNYRQSMDMRGISFFFPDYQIPEPSGEWCMINWSVRARDGFLDPPSKIVTLRTKIVTIRTAV